MGLAASQVRLLTLTARKADIELDLTIFSKNKMSLTREMSQLSSEYYAKLQNKQISYYANSKYNTINYNYLMGGADFSQIIQATDSSPYKTNNSMILTDYKGNVALSSYYAEIFAGVMGLSSKTSGGVCNPSNAEYAKMLNQICSNYTENDYTTVMNGGTLKKTVETESGEVDGSSTYTTACQKIIDFYLPIFKAAAANGWTTEYQEYWEDNTNYISDALVSGILQLAIVGDDGNYTTEDSLDYFITAGYVQTNTSSETREEITAWYEAEKLVLTNKENYWDTEINNASTELEAIKTEIDSVKSLIEDATSVFAWNT